MDRAIIAPIPTIITESSGQPALTSAKRGGRPTAADSARLGDVILDAAASHILRVGYAAASIEAIAAAAGVSKRTLYARFANKAALFASVVDRLLSAWLPSFDLDLSQADGLEDSLTRAADRMVAVALTPEALSLHRVVIAEAERFPELAAALHTAGSGLGIQRIAGVLAAHVPGLDPNELPFLAEQFQTMILTGPQARALGLGKRQDSAERAEWVRKTVRLFLRGVRYL